MSEYELIVGVAAGEPGRYTRSSLVRKMILEHGGSPVVWKRRIRELEDGRALVLRINPEARQMKSYRRAYVGTSSVATALAWHAVAPSRVRADDRAGRRAVAAASPPTHQLPPAIAAERDHRQWVEANWWTMSPQEQRHWDYDRHVAEARKRAPRRPTSVRLGGPVGHPGAVQPGGSPGISEDGFPLYRRT